MQWDKTMMDIRFTGWNNVSTGNPGNAYHAFVPSFNKIIYFHKRLSKMYQH
jgi:hypothetical protein